MKILFVGFSFSIHTVRWINQLSDTGWELHLYSSHRFSKPHAQLSSKIIYHNNPIVLPADRPFLIKLLNKFSSIFNKTFSSLPPEEKELGKLINKIQPDIIHTLQTQHAGYLVNSVKQSGRFNEFPVWVHSNWGVDLHIFSRLKDHISPIKFLLSNIDVFITEGKRDANLAKQLGFDKKLFTFPSVGGGFHIPSKPPIDIQNRKLILLKGTQDCLRRGLNGIRALERCIHLLKGYRIILYSSCYDTRVSAELFSYNNGIEMEILGEVSHNEMMELNAKARLNICINISDGLPNAMIEAMLMGAFPIQSDTSLADEWIQDGITGFIVPAEDSDVIAEKIAIALTNDKLVENASSINYNLIAKTLNYDLMKKNAIEMYDEVVTRKKFIGAFD